MDADKSPGALARDVYHDLVNSRTSLRFNEAIHGESHHGFYLLGAIVNRTEIDVNLSDEEGRIFKAFMERVFSPDHQVWDHIESSSDEEFEDDCEIV